MFQNSSNSVLASEVAEYLNKKMYGEDIVVYGPSTLDNVTDRSIVYVQKGERLSVEIIRRKEEVLVLCDYDLGADGLDTYIVTPNPELDFVHVVNKFFRRAAAVEIHKKAVIEEGAKLGKDISVYSGSYIGPEVEIGDNTIVFQNVVIAGRVKIGSNCVIKPNSSIGSEIFNFVYGQERWEQFPQVGGVIIGDYVWIGANSTIEKGTLSDTVVGDGTKIDDLVQVGSSCVIGRNSIIAAGSVLCHHVNVGEKCWIAPNASILEELTIGDNSVIGLGSVVVESVPSKTVVAGNPAQPLKNKIKT